MKSRKNSRKTLKVGIAVGVVAVVGVLMWGLVLGGFSTGDSGNSTGNVTQLVFTNRTSLETGRVSVRHYRLGEVVTAKIVVKNGKNATVDFAFDCKQTNLPAVGYVIAPAGFTRWFQFERVLTLAPGTTGEVLVSMLVPADTPDDEFIAYTLTEEGSRYLDQARAKTTTNPDAYAMAFKEGLKSLPDVYARFDELYATRGDKHIFGVIRDAFPQHRKFIAETWEAARKKVVSDLEGIPYAKTLSIIEQAGSLSVLESYNYPEIRDLPPEYVSLLDLREHPWEVLITVMELGQQGMIRAELACRWLVSMEK